MVHRSKEHLIVSAQVLEEVPYHDIARAEHELGPVFRFIDNEFFPNQDLVVRIRRVDQVPVEYKPYVECHRHDVSQFYAVTDGLTIEVTLDSERHEVSGPATVFIPAGMMHTVFPLRGKGYLIVILKKGRYE